MLWLQPLLMKSIPSSNILNATRHLVVLTTAYFLNGSLPATRALGVCSNSGALSSENSVCVNTVTMKGPNIKLIPNEKLYVSEPSPEWFGNGRNSPSNPHWTNRNWLKSRFHFSFAEYNNAKNSDFGVLRVMNDDLVQPERGFGTHPHRNMEIITYVVEGELTHQDSMGTKESLGRGSIQFMTAGTGVQHSEFNLSKEKPLRFIQSWIVPSKINLKPNYGSATPSTGPEMKGKLRHLISNVEDKTSITPVEINQDIDGYAAELQLGQKVVHKLDNERQGYLLCLEGTLKVNGIEMKRYDACEITGNGSLLEIEAVGTETTESGDVAHFLMYTMKAVPGSGRKDF